MNATEPTAAARRLYEYVYRQDAKAVQSVASIIIDQMGGIRRLSVMTGARDFLALPDGVQFKLGAGAKGGVNKARIILTPADTYTVECWKIRGANATLVSTSEDVYADSLSRVFEHATGFSLSL